MRKSINKTTVIIVLAVFLTISVGYALFSDTITIEGTATAQGNFDLTATCTMGLESNLMDAMGMSNEDLEDNGYKSESCVVSDDKAIINVELEYPGSNRSFTVNIKNTGSIDTFIKLDSNIESAASVYESGINLKATNTSTGEVINKTYNLYNEDEFSANFPTLGFMATWVRLSDGTYLIEDSNDYLTNAMIYEDSNGNYYLKVSPNETLIAYGSVSWYEDALMQGYTSETKFTIPYEFVQKTSDMEVVTDAEVCLAGC